LAMPVNWVDGPLIGFDLETTGVDTKTARPVSAAILMYVNGEPTKVKWHTLINPGIEIPDDATAIHGITNAMVIAHGRPILDSIVDIFKVLFDAAKNSIPIVGMNLAYDLSLLNSCTNGFLEAVGVPIVLDLYVIDKFIDRYRKGSRKLTSICEHYGVTHAGPHDAMNDVAASVECLIALAKKYPSIGHTDPIELHHSQVKWYKDQTTSLSDHFVATGKAEAIPDSMRRWPLHVR
jgi:DNA polymerase-3 subunit epsilon